MYCAFVASLRVNPDINSRSGIERFVADRIPAFMFAGVDIASLAKQMLIIHN